MALRTDIIWHNEKRFLSELVKWEENPRLIKPKKLSELRKSFEKFNYATTVLINLDNKVVAGNQRVFRIMMDLFGKDYELDVRVPNRMLTVTEMQELALRENNDRGEFDIDLLANLFTRDELVEYGFGDEELGMFSTASAFETEFNAIDNTNCEYPIVPKLSEKYNCFIIFSDNEIDTNYLETILQVEVEKSYKCERVGKSYVLTVEKFNKILDELRDAKS